MSEYKKLRETGSGIEILVNEDGEKRYAVDLETHMIISKRQQESYRQKKEMRGKNWVACYHETIREVIKRLSLDEMGAMIKLLPYMRFNKEGRLIDNGKPMGVKEIMPVIGKKERQTKSILSALVKHGALRTEKDGRRNVYVVEPEFHTMGFTMDSPFTKLYQSFARNKLERLTTQQAGVLYAVLPFFHYKTFRLVHNPDECNEELIEPMTHGELAEMLGIDEKTLYRHMNALMDIGVIMQSRMSRIVLYTVHPDLMYRLDYASPYVNVVRKQFEDFLRARRRRKRNKGQL